jgi:ribose 5-phosphate isomerase B
MAADEQAVRKMVRRVVYRTLGVPQASQPAMARPLITELDVREAPSDGELAIPDDALITPLARQVALERRVSLVATRGGSAPGTVQEAQGTPDSARQQIVAIGADHGGYELKEVLKRYLGELGYAVTDCGTDSTTSVDYPDFALAVARLVSQGGAWRGIVVDAAGIGSCMAANKVPGVRAAMCYDYATAVNSREHNDANVLTLGAGLIGVNLARQIVEVWLKTPAGGDRHARRVDKIMQIEHRYLRGSAKE